MLDLSEIRGAFTELSDIRALAVSGGQKDVLCANRGGQVVALKIIKKYSGDEARTDREIAAVSKLSSDFVPTIQDLGSKILGGEERYYIIEEFIDGQSYREVLNANPNQSIEATAKLADDLLRACADFEAVRVVHRDIKPENLMIGNDGKLWVIDFGIARHLDLSTLTFGHFGVGTIGYAAPEQFRNIKPEINARADLFGIGVVLYESMVGHNPYLVGASDPLAVIQKMESSDLPRLVIDGDVSNQFSDFVCQLVQRFPSRRPQSASEAIDWFLPVREAILNP